MRYRSGVINMDVIDMEVKIKQGNEMLDATIEMVDGVMVVSPKVVKFEPKDGDVIYIKANSEIILIYKECKDGIGMYANFSNNKYLYIDSCGIVCDKYDVEVIRPATEKEKEMLFNKLEEKGYKWDAEKKEVVKLKWKPKDNDNYWSPSLFDSEFMPWKNSWQNSKIGNKRLEKGWVFRTDKECQEFCNRLNDTINSVKP